MRAGVAYVAGACLCWSLVFIIPNLIQDYSPLEVVLGRCLFFGVLSIFVLIFKKRTLIFSLSKKIWGAAAGLALLGSLVHYCALVLSLRYINPTIPTLFLGLTPVCVVFVYNMKIRTQLIKLLVPSLLILGGLILINAPYLKGVPSTSAMDYSLGIFWSLIALLTWVWFIMGSAIFLGKTPSLTTGDWITILGVATFFWVIIAVGIMISPFITAYPIDKYLVWTDESIVFLICTALLGFCSSWLGSYMWNQAALRISLGLAGQLSILEAVFGLILIHLVAWKLPTFIETAGMLVILSGILVSLNTKESRLIHD